MCCLVKIRVGTSSGVRCEGFLHLELASPMEINGGVGMREVVQPGDPQRMRRGAGWAGSSKAQDLSRWFSAQPDITLVHV